MDLISPSPVHARAARPQHHRGTGLGGWAAGAFGGIAGRLGRVARASCRARRVVGGCKAIATGCLRWAGTRSFRRPTGLSDTAIAKGCLRWTGAQSFRRPTGLPSPDRVRLHAAATLCRPFGGSKMLSRLGDIGGPRWFAGPRRQDTNRPIGFVGALSHSPPPHRGGSVIRAPKGARRRRHDRSRVVQPRQRQTRRSPEGPRARPTEATRRHHRVRQTRRHHRARPSALSTRPPRPLIPPKAPAAPPPPIPLARNTSVPPPSGGRRGTRGGVPGL